MNDLLGDVKESFARRRALQGPGHDVEMGELLAQAQAQDQDVVMREFLTSAEAINGDLTRIKVLQQEIVQLHESSKALAKSRDVQRAREEMNSKCLEVTVKANQIKQKLEELERKNLATKASEGKDERAVKVRVRSTMILGLRKKLKDELDEFSSLRGRVQGEYREVVERRMYTVTGQHLNEDELDHIIQSGEAEEIFKKAVITDQVARRRVMDTLAEVQERNLGMKQLLASLEELFQMQLDMAVLVESQGQQLDSIAEQVNVAGEHVHHGTTALVGAKNYQKKSRKLMCWAAIIIAIIIIVIIIAVVLSVKPWQK